MPSEHTAHAQAAELKVTLLVVITGHRLFLNTAMSGLHKFSSFNEPVIKSAHISSYVKGRPSLSPALWVPLTHKMRCSKKNTLEEKAASTTLAFLMYRESSISRRDRLIMYHHHHHHLVEPLITNLFLHLIKYNDTHTLSKRLPWMDDRLVAEAAFYNTQLTREKYPCPQRDPKPQF